MAKSVSRTVRWQLAVTKGQAAHEKMQETCLWDSAAIRA